MEIHCHLLFYKLDSLSFCPLCIPACIQGCNIYMDAMKDALIQIDLVEQIKRIQVDICLYYIFGNCDRDLWVLFWFHKLSCKSHVVIFCTALYSFVEQLCDVPIQNWGKTYFLRLKQIHIYSPLMPNNFRYMEGFQISKTNHHDVRYYYCSVLIPKTSFLSKIG